ncbi:hypothetical protein [Amycolatopsis tolypomycina]|uniref:hypothetical protein n=1 Tax=Amycolatopsis tolypomycina TaxID=208445 RepID=UPI0033A1AB86
MNELPSTKVATAALVLGVLGWIAFLGAYGRPGLDGDVGEALYYQTFSVLAPVILPLLSISFGHLGLRRAHAGARCRGRSTTALVLGYLLLIIEVARFVAMTAH